MSILAWLVVGLIAGFIASKIINKRGEGILMAWCCSPTTRWSAEGCSDA
jgi:uncharacterized membrane protein YeaQ/YmgE (transglycosylase-associated protein family)